MDQLTILSMLQQKQQHVGTHHLGIRFPRRSVDDMPTSQMCMVIHAIQRLPTEEVHLSADVVLRSCLAKLTALPCLQRAEAALSNERLTSRGCRSVQQRSLNDIILSARRHSHVSSCKGFPSI